MKRTPVVRRRCAGVVAAAVLAMALPACSFEGAPQPLSELTGDDEPRADRPGPGLLAGRVTDEAGDPVPAAAVSLGGSEAVSDADGRFVVQRPDDDGLLTATSAEAYGYAPVDAQDAASLAVTTRPRAGGTSTVRLAGEVRTGRTVLPRSSRLQDYVGALAGVAPLLGLADSSAVTLASPLLPDPWARGSDASDDLLADALAESGVDVVNLATDRVADAGRDGVVATLGAVEAAGLVATGAGRDLDAAWLPAVTTAGDLRVAHLGCQVGADDAPWAATDDRPGAAPCDPDRLRRSVTAAVRDADTAVVLVRGGVSSPAAERLVATAARAGADVVVGTGSHTLGTVGEAAGATTAQDLGDLLTEDLSWRSRDGILLRADVGGDDVTPVGAEPYTRSDGRPSMVRGAVAAEIARAVTTTGRSGAGPLVLAGDLAVRGGDGWGTDQTTLPVPVSDDGAPAVLADGWWLPPAGEAGVGVGRALTPTGSFEDVDADPSTDGALGWFLSPGAELVDDLSLVCRGRLAVRMEPRDGRPASVFTSGRVPLTEASGLSISATLRDLGPDELTGRLSLEWFDGDTKVGEDYLDLQGLDTGCGSLRLDAIPPATADSVRPLVVVREGVAALDDLEVVAWQPGRAGGRQFSRIRVFEPKQVTLVADVPRGAAVPPGPFADADATGGDEG